MENRIPRRIIQKHDTEENWLKAENFIPLEAEWIIYDEDTTHRYKRVKLGDGKTNVNQLPFMDEILANSAAIQEIIRTYVNEAILGGEW